MGLKRTIKNLGPYPSLLLLAVPTATVEPLKLVALAVAGKGHWITGTAMIVACYLLSLCVVERLFAIVKPKLLTLPWFAKWWSVRRRCCRCRRPASTATSSGHHILPASASRTGRTTRDGKPSARRRELLRPLKLMQPGSTSHTRCLQASAPFFLVRERPTPPEWRPRARLSRKRRDL